MANATAPSAGHTESVVLSPGVERVTGRPAWRISRPLAALWAVLVVLLIAFLAVGTVRIGAGFWYGRRMRIREIWTRFLGFLADQGATQMILAGLTLLVVASMLLGAVYLWFALTLRDADAGAMTNDALER